MSCALYLADDEIDVGASSDEDVSDNEFSSNAKAAGRDQKRKRGFSFDFDDGEVIGSDMIMRITFGTFR